MEARLDPRHRFASIAATSAASITMVVMVSLVGAGDAYAQSAEAETLFDDGNQLMTEGKLAQACDAFEASNRIEPGAGTLILLGDCREKNQQLASAWSAYKDALIRAKDQNKIKLAKARATALEARLSYLTVSVSDDSRVDGLMLTRNGKPFDSILWNRALPVDGGDYIISGSAPGHEEWQTTAHVPVEGAKISVEVPKFKELGKLIAPPTPAAEPAPPVTTPGTTPATTPPVAEHREPEAGRSMGMFTTRRKIALGVAGGSVISLVTGVIVGELAKQKQTDAFTLCPDPATPCTQADQSNALLKSAHSRAFVANVAFGIAAAGAIGAGVLWLTGAPGAEDSRRISVTPRVAPGETGFVLLGRF